jgi:beta-glucanase (GH16 family)
MKKLIALVVLLLVVIASGCKAKKGVSGTNENGFVDVATPKTATPFLLSDATSKEVESKKWKLVFSDEFNDTKMDTTKWNVEKSTKKRVDIMLYADENQVEEKDGKVYIYYRKSNLNDTTYMAGRFNSHKKYAPTYGFMESRIHLVKPNGYQMAFWMMPEGKGMASATTPDGTANDGAEIDIVEGNKLNAFSSGLHWDGYAKPAHKSNGSLNKMLDLYETEYHIFGFEWTPTYLKFYYDGKLIRTMTDPKFIPKVAHFLYFSGSCFGKSDWVDGDVRQNEFIQKGGVEKAYVDYVRVYQTNEMK